MRNELFDLDSDVIHTIGLTEDAIQLLGCIHEHLNLSNLNSDKKALALCNALSTSLNEIKSTSDLMNKNIQALCLEKVA